jgi:hypothetical protein
MAFGDGAATVDATRFDQAGSWSAPPELWSDLVDDRLAALATISLTGRIAEVTSRRRCATTSARFTSAGRRIGTCPPTPDAADKCREEKDGRGCRPGPAGAR